MMLEALRLEGPVGQQPEGFRRSTEPIPAAPDPPSLRPQIACSSREW